MMDSRIFLTFGPVNILVESEPEVGAILDILSRWFLCNDVQPTTSPDIVFRLANTRDIAKSAAEGLAMEVLHMEDNRAWEVFLSVSQQNTTTAWQYVCVPRLGARLRIIKHFPSFFIRFLSPEFADLPYFRASYFVYNVMLPALQVALLARGATFIHASSIVGREGEGVLFSGWGGSGKTTASSYLYLTNPVAWSFLSDDLAIIDRKGRIWLNPFPINIFPYNTNTFPRLAELLDRSMAYTERLHWKVFRWVFGMKGGMRRRAPLEGTYRECLAKISFGIHIERRFVSEFQVETLPASEFAKIAKNILLFELRNKSTLFSLVNSIKDGARFCIPSLDEVGIRAEAIYSSALKDINLRRVSVPKNASTQEVGKFFEDFLQGENSSL